MWLVLAMNRASGHFRRLASHFTLPLVRSLCWVTQCFSCSFTAAALYEQLACDCISLMASSSSAAAVSCMVSGSVTRCVVIPRCRSGWPTALPVVHLCCVAGHIFFTIILTCNLKCCRLCPRLNLHCAVFFSSLCGYVGDVKPIMWYMMKSSIHVLPLMMCELVSL